MINRQAPSRAGRGTAERREPAGPNDGGTERPTERRGRDRHSTSAEIAEVVIQKLDLFKGLDLLVCTPGRTDIASRIRKSCPGPVPTFVEPDMELRRELKLQRYDLIDAEDLNEVDCWPGFDRIVSIPPCLLTDTEDFEHVRHGFELLKPGGRLVAVITESEPRQTCPSTNGSARFGGRPIRTSPTPSMMNCDASDFHDWLEDVGGEIEDLPDGLLFEGEGPTTVRARLVVISRPEEPADNTTAAAELEVAPVTAVGA